MDSSSTDPVIDALHARMAAEGTYGIFRLQARRDRSVALEGTRVESVGSSYTGGLGVQVFTPGGHNGFSAIDDPDEERALRAAERALAAARASKRAGLVANPAILTASPHRGRDDGPAALPLEHLDVGEMREEAGRFGEEVCRVAGSVKARTSFGVSRDEWRVARTDGTDVSFVINRSTLGVALTGRGEGQAARASVSTTGISYELLLDPSRRLRLLDRVERVARLVRELLDAPAWSSPWSSHEPVSFMGACGPSEGTWIERFARFQGVCQLAGRVAGEAARAGARSPRESILTGRRAPPSPLMPVHNLANRRRMQDEGPRRNVLVGQRAAVLLSGKARRGAGPRGVAARSNAAGREAGAIVSASNCCMDLSACGREGYGSLPGGGER